MTRKSFSKLVCIGVFIHNEESHIGSCLKDLADQSVFQNQETRVQVYLLCNGCTDRSIKISSELAQQYNYQVLNWFKGGKSRTWNRFVHEIIPNNVRTIVFLDGDIRLPENRTIERLLSVLNSTTACVATSRPEKDTSLYPYWNPLRLIARLIKRPHQDGSIAGSLYAMKASCIKNIWLPRLCLVEDGFLAATIITKHFQSSIADKSLVRAAPGTLHIFEPPSDISEFFRHDVRLALGTELNAALFTPLWGTGNLTETHQLLREFAIGNRINSAIAEHIEKRHNQTLGIKRLLSYVWPKGQNLIKGLILFPLRIGHMIYMAIVFRSAWLKFTNHQFKW